MVKARSLSEAGSMMIELVMALALVVTILLPLGLSFVDEQHACRVYYWRAVAMETVDGEMEVLAAGDWRSFHEGTEPYNVHSEAAKHLPNGQFLLTIHGSNLRLEWRPDKIRSGAPVAREAVGR
jgi:hypothetical protein